MRWSEHKLGECPIYQDERYITLEYSEVPILGKSTPSKKYFRYEPCTECTLTHDASEKDGLCPIFKEACKNS